MHCLAHAILNMRTEYQFSIFHCYEDIRGSQNLKIGHVSQATFLGSIFHPSTKRSCNVFTQNLECVSLAVQKLWRGPKFKI